MSSSSDPMTERLLCSICLDVFSDPVSTPCGHNFCKICLNTHWNNSQDYRCPNCKETFNQRPDLKINTTLRDVVDHFEENSREKQAEVVCDFCTEGKLKAVKSCLVCQSSYCETHLESHLRVSGLQKHKLIDPVKNLQDYMCQKHDRPLELFCRDDHTCVCLICTVTDHKNHNTVPLREEKHQEDLSRQQKSSSDDSFKFWFLVVGLALFVLSACFIQAYKDIQRREAETLERLETSKTEITELKMKNNELDLDMQHREAVLKWMQQYAVEAHPKLIRSGDKKQVRDGDNMHDVPDNPKSFDTYPNVLEKEGFSSVRFYKFLVAGLVLFVLSAYCIQAYEDTQRREAVLKWMQQFAVDVTLDPDTAHPKLILSDDEKQVRTGDMKNKLPDNPKRFNRYFIVLGKEGFSSGRFYYEVQVKGKTKWSLGVVRESVKRKGQITLTPDDGFWTVVLRNDYDYRGAAGPSVSLSLRVKPQKVGVFVDYEEGLVSFYDVENRSHIYSFSDQYFTEKLYPYFSPEHNDKGKNSEPLIITPVDDNR